MYTTKISTMSKVIHHRLGSSSPSCHHTVGTTTYHQAGAKQILMSIGQLLLLRYSMSGLSRLGYEANESQRAAGLKMINQTWRRHVAKTDDLEEYPDFRDW